LEEPSSDKKFLRFKYYSISDEAYTLAVKTRRNFMDATYQDLSIPIDGTNSRSEVSKLKGALTEAMMFTFSNNESNTDISLHGFEIEFEEVGRKMRK